ncbi:MAG: hypothetical protein JWN24_2015 [Phycisphaerales bacterium]|nr:hypothetical protein [Phycisphaerales bacterium]
MRHAHMASGGRYPVLRSIAILLIVASGVELVTGVVGAVYWFRSAHPVDTAANVAMVMAAILAGTFLAALGTVALAELIKLLVDIEHNSRMALHGVKPDDLTAATTENGGKHGTWMEGEETAEGALIRGH